ncbi:MAG: hypothetical protein COW11_03190 [Candidatus Omnitrophica bacterium CG12_big_fil_rev_8_21_14_0_65_43_15]|uniref:Uncharacterized protein n=1 Tax=Candidatus Taenaricola geysiri TaxID=1974752 RepID=A0A2J0LRJ0_9BACT|nr:MAG: hypothetical protein AUJ89_04825 [Candidatus Omnitrophica bacterium CG1_02_43_210]PIV12545.1 MAG: hypothetical protein COS48_00460 [Candidatus Omnitrophica bacterium CG03_land_8_20_14_0_80_43_22]PIW66457.1 MAG: hypothetical protein COW11_03190 [Candidatus Omnitrophica bacterium CG12_big_fil_rev_8_21_14_0_65_43_15]PIW80262.1 MAG: hypothetical protein COZ98_03375 [Candidatus Omnitrophica bacterium CG_4_8_14_3_um_filter_43_15]PJC46246.1 MAG: hypothetical protein CO036_03995 [Candidatus Omn
MDKHKKEQIILLIAVGIFVIMLPRMLFKKKPAIVDSPVMEEMSPVFREEAPLPIQAVDDLSASQSSAASDKDPFCMPQDLSGKMKSSRDSDAFDEEGVSLPGVNITGVVWGGDSPFAFINDKVYIPGNEVEGYQIIDIDKRGVYFLDNGEKILVKVKK